MPMDVNDFTPKYVQIQNYILENISSGEFPVGAQIPSEAELSKKFDVSRITANTAIKELATRGVVDRVRGKGTFVLPPMQEGGEQPMAFASGIRAIPVDATGRKPHFLVEQGMVMPGEALRHKLELREDEFVYKIVRRVDVAGKPSELDFSYIPLSICGASSFNCEALEKTFLHDYMKKHMNVQPATVKIFINTTATEDMDLSVFELGKNDKLMIWDTYVCGKKKVLAVTTTVSVFKENKPFIALEL